MIIYKSYTAAVITGVVCRGGCRGYGKHQEEHRGVAKEANGASGHPKVVSFDSKKPNAACRSRRSMASIETAQGGHSRSTFADCERSLHNPGHHERGNTTKQRNRKKTHNSIDQNPQIKQQQHPPPHPHASSEISSRSIKPFFLHAGSAGCHGSLRP
jgi:hypothetical protein